MSSKVGTLYREFKGDPNDPIPPIEEIEGGPVDTLPDE